MWSRFMQSVFGGIKVFKTFSEILPGFILTVSIMLLIGTCKNLTVFPVSSLNSLKTEMSKIAGILKEHASEMSQTEQSSAELKEQLDRARTWQEVLNSAYEKTAADFGGKVQEPVRKTRANELLKLKADNEVKINSLFKQYKAQSIKAVSMADSVEHYKKRQAALESEIKLAGSLKGNLDAIGNNFMELLLAGVVLGVIMSQISRRIFLVRLFDDRLQREWGNPEQCDVDYRVRHIVLSNRSVSYFAGRGLLSKDSYEDIVTGYYNYTEVCVNNIIPVCVAGISLVCFVLSTGWKGFSPWVILAAGLLAYGLYEGGYTCHKRYKQKVAEMILAAYESACGTVGNYVCCPEFDTTVKVDGFSQAEDGSCIMSLSRPVNYADTEFKETEVTEQEHDIIRIRVKAERKSNNKEDDKKSAPSVKVGLGMLDDKKTYVLDIWFSETDGGGNKPEFKRTAAVLYRPGRRCMCL